MMKTAKSFATLFVLALAAFLAPAASAQARRPQTPVSKTSPALKKTTKARAPKKTVKAKAVQAKPAASPVAQAEPKRPVALPVSKRDPFAPLIAVSVGGGGAYQHLPPGKAGLQVGTLRVDGAVQGPNGMLAVVSNPEDSVYFVRVGDRLYDGDVEKISLDGVTFQQNSKDAFGKMVERLVTKRIYPNAGESQ